MIVDGEVFFGAAEGVAEGITVAGGIALTVLVVRSCRDSIEVVFLIETSELSTFTFLCKPKSGSGRSKSARDVDGVGLGSFAGAVGEGVKGLILCVVMDRSYTVPASHGCLCFAGGTVWVGGIISSSDSEDDDSFSELEIRLLLDFLVDVFFLFLLDVSGRGGGAAGAGGWALTASRIWVDIDVMDATVSLFICVTCVWSSAFIMRL